MSAAVPRAILDSHVPPQVVAQKYELVREIGRGGMGVVFEALNTWTHRRVALKILHPDLPSTVQQRLFEEARTASRLSHRHVVDILDMGVAENGSLFLVQELLEGEDLHERLERVGCLDPRDALAILLPVVDALACAHERGIVHRDVKPSNIVLARDAQGALLPKLVDFGIAKRLDPERAGYPRLTADGTLLGTPHYMAPEQILDEEVGPAADVWAIGVCLHEALTGRVPFASTQMHVVLREIQHLDASCLATLVGVQGSFAAPIRAALTLDPEARPSMRELSAMLACSLESARDPDDRDLENDAEPTVIELSRPSSRRLRATLDDDAAGLLETGSLDALGPRELVRGALRIGLVITARDVDTLQLGDAFQRTLERACDVARFRSYAELVDAVGEGDVDLAWLPPVAYVRAARLGAARILATIERAGRAAYASALLGRRGAVASYDDLAGGRAVWVDGWSAAGYLVPRAMMRRRGHDPDLALRSQGFVGSYDAVLDALASGTADVGAAFCTIDATGRIVRRPWSEEHGVVPIEVSAPIPGDTFCASSHLPDDVHRALRASLTDPRGAAPLVRLVGASCLAPGDPTRYRALERALVSREARGSQSIALRLSGD